MRSTASVIILVILCISNLVSTDDSECGGLVTVKIGESVTLTYKEETEYENLERCTWALLPEEGVTLSSITITYEKQGFSSLNADGLTFYGWTDAGNFEGVRIPSTTFGSNNNNQTYETSQGFLFWTSDGQDIGRGFRLSVIGLESLNGSVLSGGRDVVGAHGEIGQVYQIEYPPFPLTQYDNEARLAIVFRHEPTNPEPSRFKIDYLDTEEGSDVLELFALNPFHAKNDDPAAYFLAKCGCYSGQHHNGFPDILEASENLIGLFTSDENGSGRGFSIRWF